MPVEEVDDVHRAAHAKSAEDHGIYVLRRIKEDVLAQSEAAFSVSQQQDLQAAGASVFGGSRSQHVWFAIAIHVTDGQVEAGIGETTGSGTNVAKVPFPLPRATPPCSTRSSLSPYSNR